MKLFIKILLPAAALFACANASAGSVQALEPMLGDWQGGGWMQRGPERAAFTGHESVRYALDGNALLVEGQHFTERDGRKVPVHNALALIRASAEGGYSIHSFLSDGRDIEGWARWQDGEFVWGFSLPEHSRDVRYRVQIDGDSWREVGETRANGSEWVKFFEMTLERQ